MEVTNENFTELLPQIKDAIEKADFLAIDTELTGLRRSADEEYNELDTHNERYEKLRMAAQNFGIIQFGLSAFRFVPDTKSYAHCTFCFYLLNDRKQIISMDSSSMRFLANNEFDFNKLFKYGIPYMTLLDDTKKREELAKAVPTGDAFAPSPVKVVDVSLKKFVATSLARMKAFLDDPDQEMLLFDNATLNGLHRKVLYNNVAAQFPNVLLRSVPPKRDLQARKFDSLEDKQNFVQMERQMEHDKQCGFTHVVRHILEKGKPIVGHNMALDLVHFVEKFVQPLPDTLDEFKSQVVKSNLPPIYDTKIISSDPPFSGNIFNTALETLYEKLSSEYKPPIFRVEDGLASYSTEGKSRAHDAGYDAYMTGVSFVTMLKNLDKNTWTKHSVVESKHAAHFANKLYNMFSFDIPFIDLVGPDVLPKRNHIFAVHCPKEWTIQEVRGLFSRPVVSGNTRLVWVNCNLVYVIPLEEEDCKNVPTILKNVQSLCPPLVKIQMYSSGRGTKRNMIETCQDGLADASACNVQDFKRLKSVDSEKLSQMTLTSPISEVPPCRIGGNGVEASDGIFAVPDEW